VHVAYNSGTSSIYSLLFNDTCASSGCHLSTSPAFGIPWVYVVGDPATTYTELSGELISGAPSSSKLYVRPCVDKDMPPSPGPVMSPADCALIFQWITEGALQN
jgi:hypothetical protein